MCLDNLIDEILSHYIRVDLYFGQFNLLNNLLNQMDWQAHKVVTMNLASIVVSLVTGCFYEDQEIDVESHMKTYPKILL